MRLRLLVSLAALGVSSAVFAHTGVQNPAVLARMDGMKSMGGQMEVLVPMVRGATAFDAAQVTAAMARLAEEADAAVILFRDREVDPRMEALEVIWTEYEDFEGRLTELARLARGYEGAIADLDALRGAVREIGASCTGCHEIYRAEQ